MQVARLRVLARAYGLQEIVAQGSAVRLSPVELPESATMRLTRLYPRTIVKPAVRTILVPRPTGSPLSGPGVQGTDLLEWTQTLITSVLPGTKVPSKVENS